MRNNNKNIQDAKLAAQRLYKKVNFDGTNLQTYQLSSLLQQTYDFLKIPFKPTTNDLKQYSKVLDANSDGSVSLQDLQTMAVNYLCGQGVLGQTSTKKSVGFSQNQFSSSQYQSQSYGSNKYLYQQPQSFSQGFNQSNIATSHYSNDQGYTNSAHYVSSNSYNVNSYETYNNKSNSGSSNSQQYQQTYNNPVNQNTFIQNGQNNQGSRVNQTQQHLTSKQYGQHQQSGQQKSKYTATAQNYLNITRELFKKYSNQSSNTITKDRVAVLLTQTYGALGRKGYYPTEQDVNVWMKLCDTNADGHVEQAQYQYFVVRALERSGIQTNA